MKKDKLLLFIEKRWKDTGSDWQPELEKINMWNSVHYIYDAFNRTRANQLLAYVVYGYSLHSDWLEPQKDRFENLERIMASVTGTATCGEDDRAIIIGKNTIVNDLINFVLDNQEDARFRDVCSSLELHAIALRFDKEGWDSKKLLDTCNLLKQARQLWQDTMALYNQIKQEYLPLNIALEKEGRPQMGSTLEFSWKANIDRRNAATEKKE